MSSHRGDRALMAVRNTFFLHQEIAGDVCVLWGDRLALLSSNRQSSDGSQEHIFSSGNYRWWTCSSRRQTGFAPLWPPLLPWENCMGRGQTHTQFCHGQTLRFFKKSLKIILKSAGISLRGYGIFNTFALVKDHIVTSFSHFTTKCESKKTLVDPHCLHLSMRSHLQCLKGISMWNNSTNKMPSKKNFIMDLV